MVGRDVRNDRKQSAIGITHARAQEKIVFAPADMRLRIEIDVAVPARQKHDRPGRLVGLHHQHAI